MAYPPPHGYGAYVPPPAYGAPPAYGGPPAAYAAPFGGMPPGYGGVPLPMSGDPHVSPQFQQPTKVVHLRNLPFDVTLEEIRELCAPWGTIVAMKDKVGGNRNQAFVEFATLEQALAIVKHYQSAVEPAKFRGRPSWLSFSGRDRLTNVAASTDNPTPVLQVTVNNIAPDLQHSVNLELLNTMFGAYGFVKKLVTHPKPEGGLLAWVQFPDAATAATVRNSLQGQPIPRHLVNDHANPPTLDMAFAATPDLAIRAQSHCTRDFTTAAIPWGEPDLSIVQGLLPAAGGTDGASNVLSISFDKMTYPVTVEGLHTICSTYGTVQKIHIFDRDGRTVAFVQYPDVQIAVAARSVLEGHAMYDGGHNVMHVVYSKHRNLAIRPGADRSKDFTGGALPVTAPPPAAAPTPAAMQGRPGPPAGAPPGAPTQQRPPMGGPPPPYGGGAPAASYNGPPPPRVDPHFQVTGEDFVRQHERVLEQYGGRTSGRGTPAPYAAPAAYGGYVAPAAPPAYPPPAAPGYGAPPAYGAAPAYAAPPAYGAAPPAYGAAQAYGAPSASYGYGAQQQAPSGAYYGAPAPQAQGYGAAPPPGGPPPLYGQQPPGGIYQQQAYGR